VAFGSHSFSARHGWHQARSRWQQAGADSVVDLPDCPTVQVVTKTGRWLADHWAGSQPMHVAWLNVDWGQSIELNPESVARQPLSPLTLSIMASKLSLGQRGLKDLAVNYAAPGRRRCI